MSHSSLVSHWKPLAFGLALLFVAAPGSRAGDEGADEAPTVAILVELWRVDEAELVSELEALTAQDVGAAEAVRARLAAAGEHAKRVSRFLTTTSPNSPVLQSDLQQVTQVVETQTTGGAVRGGFGGFIEIGTTLSLQCHLVASSAIEVTLSLTASGIGEAAQRPAMPPAQWKVRIEGSVSAPSGGFRMFQSNAWKNDTAFVFVQPTRL